MSVGNNTLDGQSAALSTSERSLGALWRRADRLADGLITEDGRRLRIVYPGKPSSRPGPDFVDAVLTGAAVFLSRYLEKRLVDGMHSEVKRADGRPIWPACRSFRSSGSGRAGEMAVNAVLSFLDAYASAGRDLDLAGRSIAVYRGLPKLEDNEVMQEMQRRLFSSKDAPKLNARRQQGLVHLYKRLITGPPTAVFEQPHSPTVSATPASA